MGDPPAFLFGDPGPALLFGGEWKQGEGILSASRKSVRINMCSVLGGLLIGGLLIGLLIGLLFTLGEDGKAT